MAQDTSTGSTGPAGSPTTKRTAAAKQSSTKRAAARSSKSVATPSKPAAKSTAKAPTAKPTAKAPTAKPIAASKPPAASTEVIVVPAAFDTNAGPMTPAVAVSRHLEWLDYALAAARAEETWRRGRLEKATRKNRSKRESRLAEVLAEIEELAALVIGLRVLQKGTSAKKPARRRASGARRARAGTSTTATRRATTGTGAG